MLIKPSRLFLFQNLICQQWIVPIFRICYQLWKYVRTALPLVHLIERVLSLDSYGNKYEFAGLYYVSLRIRLSIYVILYRHRLKFG